MIPDHLAKQLYTIVMLGAFIAAVCGGLSGVFGVLYVKLHYDNMDRELIWLDRQLLILLLTTSWTSISTAIVIGFHAGMQLKPILFPDAEKKSENNSVA